MEASYPITSFQTGINSQSLGQLVHTVQELSMARDLESVMRIVRTVARNLTGADGATFVLREGDMCYYADEEAIAPLWKGNRFPMNTCISGWVMLHKREAVIDDVYADERIPADAYRPTFVKSLAMVPIRTLNPIGAIGNYWASHHQPTGEELALLQALANITAVSIENIQIRNQLEEKVMERTRELSESLDREKEMNEMKSAFVSFASHEFRTPLSGINTSADLLENYRQRKDFEKQIKHIERIKSSVGHLTHILNDFLSLERLESKKVSPECGAFDISQFLQRMADDTDDQRKPGQNIAYTHEGPTSVLTDQNILRNVITNLLSNGIKYSEQEINMRSMVKEGLLTIAIEDKGIGISESAQSNIFGKFFRAGNAAHIQGTGLGLMIVKRYVELLRGNIDFVSVQDQGTCFTVKIPCS